MDVAVSAHEAGFPALCGVTGLASLLTPGTLVRHPEAPEWGLGQVQSSINGRVTVNFENEGKVVIDANLVPLELVFDT